MHGELEKIVFLKIYRCFWNLRPSTFYRQRARVIIIGRVTLWFIVCCQSLHLTLDTYLITYESIFYYLADYIWTLLLMQSDINGMTVWEKRKPIQISAIQNDVLVIPFD